MPKPYPKEFSDDVVRVARNREPGVHLKQVAAGVCAEFLTVPLKGRHPALVENILKDTPGWQVGTLGRGSAQGRGWVFRQYTDAGNPTGLQLRWRLGGGHHGPDPYWRVVGPNGDLGGIIR